MKNVRIMASLEKGISSAIRCIKRDKGDGGVISARPVKKTFCSTKGTPYYRLHKPRTDFDEVVQMTVEGDGILSISRSSASPGI